MTIPDARASEVPLTIVSQPFTVTSAQQRFVLDAGAVPPSLARTLRVSVSRRITSRTAFLEIANGQQKPSPSDRVSLSLSSLSRDAAGRWEVPLTFSFTRDSRTSLYLAGDGVHPVVFEYLDARGSVVAATTTFVERRETTLPGVATTLLLDLSPPSVLTPEGQVTMTDVVRDEVAAAVRVLSSAAPITTPIIDPRLLVALDTSPSDTDRALLADLDRVLAGRSVVNTPFGGADPSALAAAGLAGEFGGQLALGRSVLTRLLPSAVVETRTWVARRPIDIGGLLLLRNSGITSVLLAPAALDSIPERRTSPLVSARADVGDGADVEIVTADISVSSATAGTSPRREAARVVAEAVVTVDELLADGADPGSIRLAISHDGSVPSDDSLVALASMMSTHPGFVLTGFAGAHSPDLAAPEVDPIADGPRYSPEHVRLLTVSRREMDAVSSMLPDGSTTADAWARSLALGAEPDDEAMLHLSALRTVLRDRRALVTVTTPKTINLSSRDGEIRFQVRNNSDEELTVVVAVASSKLRLDEPVRTQVLVARGTTEVRVPATTRTGGLFPVAIRVSTPEGDVSVVPWLTVTARVSAIAGWGQLVSISLLLVLIAWWWSHRRSVRQRPDEEGTVPLP